MPLDAEAAQCEGVQQDASAVQESTLDDECAAGYQDAHVQVDGVESQVGKEFEIDEVEGLWEVVNGSCGQAGAFDSGKITESVSSIFDQDRVTDAVMSGDGQHSCVESAVRLPVPSVGVPVLCVGVSVPAPSNEHISQNARFNT